VDGLDTERFTSGVKCSSWVDGTTRNAAVVRVYYRHHGGSTGNASGACTRTYHSCDGLIYSRGKRPSTNVCGLSNGVIRQTLHHVLLAAESEPNGTIVAAEQIHALIPPNLLNTGTWPRSGSCHGNEPRICLDPSVNISAAFQSGLKGMNNCFMFDTAKELASTRTIHISAAVHTACSKGLAPCPFPKSSWQHVGKHIGPMLLDHTMNPHHKTCALVGSGPSSIGYGTLIDTHEAIIRFNDAPTAVQYGVGLLTTYRITYCHFGITTELCGMKAQARFSGHHIWKGGYHHSIGNRSLWALYHRTTLCINGLMACSTGMWGVAFALSVCDQINVFGYGPVFVAGVAQYARYYGASADGGTIVSAPRADSFRGDGGHHYILELAKMYALHCNGFVNLHGPGPAET